MECKGVLAAPAAALTTEQRAEQFSRSDLHWQLELLHNIDAGLVVLDRQFRIRLWNGFMEHHSGLSPIDVHNQVIFQRFPELQEAWFRSKADAVFELRCRIFTNWQQRPCLFRFEHTLPLTGKVDFMYQNSTLLPLASESGVVDHICLIIYDVTGVASSRLELEQANRELATISRRDSLTGLHNRGYWEECLAQEFVRYQRTLRPASLVMFDIDHFKQINDSHGHPAGDQALREVASWLRAILRQSDIPGRYGGEEFGVLLLDTPAASARIFAERLRRVVEAGSIRYQGEKFRLTVSVGIAACTPWIDSYSRWLSLADQALYQAKASGRNQVCMAGEQLAQPAG